MTRGYYNVSGDPINAWQGRRARKLARIERLKKRWPVIVWSMVWEPKHLGDCLPDEDGECFCGLEKYERNIDLVQRLVGGVDAWR